MARMVSAVACVTVLLGLGVRPGDGDRGTLGPRDDNEREAGELPAVSFGAPVGIRTPNLLIRSQMLYPLSYGRLSPKTDGEPA
jgi:hypothetical protein